MLSYLRSDCTLQYWCFSKHSMENGQSTTWCDFLSCAWRRFCWGSVCIRLGWRARYWSLVMRQNETTEDCCTAHRQRKSLHEWPIVLCFKHYGVVLWRWSMTQAAPCASSSVLWFQLLLYFSSSYISGPHNQLLTGVNTGGLEWASICKRRSHFITQIECGQGSREVRGKDARGSHGLVIRTVRSQCPST